MPGKWRVVNTWGTPIASRSGDVRNDGAARSSGSAGRVMTLIVSRPPARGGAPRYADRVSTLDARVRLVGGGPGGGGEYVLYWMQIARRLVRNHALDHALALAR